MSVSADNAPESSERAGLQLALLAYASWGVLALFWKQLAHVPAVEQLVHRVVWAAALLLGLVIARAQLGAVQAVLRDRKRRRRLALSAALLGTNWFVFVYAVATERVLHVSLGYYINPLVSVVLGMVVLGERLRRLQWIAVALALVGVASLLWWAGELPWIGLSVALAFGLYGLVRKTVAVDPLPGTAIEASLLALPCLAALAWLEIGSGGGHLLRGGARTSALLLAAGPVTALPILWFAGATRRLPLHTLGLMQYITPTIHFLFAVLIFGETFTVGHGVAFACIWSGVALFVVDRIRHRNQGSREQPAREQPAQPTISRAPEHDAGP